MACGTRLSATNPQPTNIENNVERKETKKDGKLHSTVAAFLLGFFLGLIGLCIVCASGDELCKKKGLYGFLISLGVSVGFGLVIGLASTVV